MQGSNGLILVEHPIAEMVPDPETIVPGALCHSLLAHGKCWDYGCVLCFPHLYLTGGLSLSRQPSVGCSRSLRLVI